MSNSSCCVVNCNNTVRNSKCRFYRFPTAAWKLEQCDKWIAAVRRINSVGSPWYPKQTDLICSDHFIGGMKSDDSTSPNYVPTIFPSMYRSKVTNEAVTASRYRRFLEWRKMNELSDNIPTEQQSIHSSETFRRVNITYKCDRECQVDMFTKFDNTGNTFTCNRYIYNKVCDAEVQTEINVKNYREMKDKVCNTPRKTYADVATSTEISDFVGFSSVCNEERLKDLADARFDGISVQVKVEAIDEEGWRDSVKREPELSPEMLQPPTGTEAIDKGQIPECSENKTDLPPSLQEIVIKRELDVEPVHIKEEMSEGDGEWDSGVSEQDVQSELYAGHVVKRELVLGPEILQAPYVATQEAGTCPEEVGSCRPTGPTNPTQETPTPEGPRKKRRARRRGKGGRGNKKNRGHRIKGTNLRMPYYRPVRVKTALPT